MSSSPGGPSAGGEHASAIARCIWGVCLIGATFAPGCSTARRVAPGAQQAVELEHSKLATEDADPVDVGSWEVEFNYCLSSATREWDNHWDSRNRGWAQERNAEAVVTYGLIENLDVALSIGYADLYDRDSDPRTGRGATDMGLAAKWRFYQDDARRLAAAYIPSITAPTGPHATGSHLGTSEEFWTIDQRLAVVKDWSDRWTTNLDVGFTAPVGPKRGDFRGELAGNAAVGYQLASWVQGELELNYAHELVDSGSDTDCVSVTAGLVMPLADGVCLRLGVQQGIAGRNADRSTAVLFSFVIGF